MKILVIGYDWSGLARRDPELLLRKLVRDRLDPEHAEILLWEFAPYKGDTHLTPSIRVSNHVARFRHLRPLYDLIVSVRIVRDLRCIKFAPDVVVLHDFPFLPAAHAVKKAFGSKIVLYLSNLPTDLAKTRRGAFLKSAYHHFFEQQASRIVDAVAAINETTRAYALSLGIVASKIFTLSPDTMATDEKYIQTVKKGSLRQRLAIPADMHIALSVGRLEGEKGFDRLIHAFATLKRKDLVLVIAGEGKGREVLEAQARREGVEGRVYFPGYVRREEIWNWYADADVFMLLSRSEALGLVVWEAMRMDVPVIVSGAGGLMESVGKDGDRGYIWNESDGIDDLSKKIDACLLRESVEPMLSRAKIYVEERTDSIDLKGIYSALTAQNV